MKPVKQLDCACGKDHFDDEETARSRHIIKAIFDSTQSFIILISLDYEVIFFNKKALHVTKLLYGMDLNVGDSFMNYQRQGDEHVFQAFKENFTQAVTSGGTIISERQMQFHETSLWFRSEYTPVFEGEKMIGVALRMVDVSERKLREQRIEKQNEELKQISWMQSHQTRQPIASILGLLNILEKDELGEYNTKVVKMIEAEVDKLDALIRDMVVRANSACEK